MESIDKNDVDISKLFNWGKNFEISNPDGTTTTVYMRLVGDADWNRSRVKALRASGELRRNLRNEESDEFLAFVPDYKAISKGRLIDMILAVSMRTYTDKVVSEMSLEIPKEPKSDATLEEQEKYQVEIDNYPEKRKEFINNKLKEIIETERKKLEKRAKDQLEEEYTVILINTMCELEMTKVFYEYCIFYGSFKDENFSELLFPDIEKFRNVASEVKDQLVKYYRSLELGISDLKK